MQIEWPDEGKGQNNLEQCERVKRVRNLQSEESLQEKGWSLVVSRRRPKAKPVFRPWHSNQETPPRWLVAKPLPFKSSEGEVKEGIERKMGEKSEEMKEAGDPVLGRIGKFGKFQARVSLLSFYLSFTVIICTNWIRFTHIQDNSIGSR